MTKEQVKRYGSVIRWWMDNLDKGVWTKHLENKWELTYEPDFYESFNFKYVENDKYAELRKAHADGKTIQVYNKKYYKQLLLHDWVLMDSLKINTDIPLKHYRIKPEEPTFDKCFIEATDEAFDLLVKETPVNRKHSSVKENTKYLYISFEDRDVMALDAINQDYAKRLTQIYVNNGKLSFNKPDFKVGDWVRQIKENYSKTPMIFKIKFFLTGGETAAVEDNKFDIDAINLSSGHFILWKPKPGEWCWYGDRLVQVTKVDDRPYITYKEDEHYVFFSALTPFIGELPEWTKVEG